MHQFQPYYTQFFIIYLNSYYKKNHYKKYYHLVMKIYFKADTPKAIKRQFQLSLKKIEKYYKPAVIESAFTQIIKDRPYNDSQTSDLVQQKERLTQQFKFNFYDKYIKYASKWQLIGFQENFNTALNKISHIEFSYLKRIDLQKCKITNIQPLTWLQAPFLAQIYLNQCFLTSLKPLQKMNLYRLRYLNIAGNNFSSIQQFKYIRKLNIKRFDIYNTAIKFCVPAYSLVYNKDMRQQIRGIRLPKKKGTPVLIYFQLLKFQKLDIFVWDSNYQWLLEIENNVPLKIKKVIQEIFSREQTWI